MSYEIKIETDAKNLDEWYFKIWSAEQEHTKIRWTVSTFFFSVSFAIFGFSFQTNLAPTLAHIARLSGLVIYWFAFLIFLQFNQYTKFLRAYLRALENQGKITLKLQLETQKNSKSRGKKFLSATKLLIYFGFTYSVVVLSLYLIL